MKDVMTEIFPLRMRGPGMSMASISNWGFNFVVMKSVFNENSLAPLAFNAVRLTLLYTPGVRHNYMDQHSQDWGRHAPFRECGSAGSDLPTQSTRTAAG